LEDGESTLFLRGEDLESKMRGPKVLVFFPDFKNGVVRKYLASTGAFTSFECFIEKLEEKHPRTRKGTLKDGAHSGSGHLPETTLMG